MSSHATGLQIQARRADSRPLNASDEAFLRRRCEHPNQVSIGWTGPCPHCHLEHLESTISMQTNLQHRKSLHCNGCNNSLIGLGPSPGRPSITFMGMQWFPPGWSPTRVPLRGLVRAFMRFKRATRRSSEPSPSTDVTRAPKKKSIPFSYVFKREAKASFPRRFAEYSLEKIASALDRVGVSASLELQPRHAVPPGVSPMSALSPLSSTPTLSRELEERDSRSDTVNPSSLHTVSEPFQTPCRPTAATIHPASLRRKPLPFIAQDLQLDSHPTHSPSSIRDRESDLVATGGTSSTNSRLTTQDPNGSTLSFATDSPSLTASAQLRATTQFDRDVRPPRVDSIGSGILST